MKIQGTELLSTPQSALPPRDSFMVPYTGARVVTGVKKTDTSYMVEFSKYFRFVPGLFRRYILMFFSEHKLNP